MLIYSDIFDIARMKLVYLMIFVLILAPHCLAQQCKDPTPYFGKMLEHASARKCSKKGKKNSELAPIFELCQNFNTSAGQKLQNWRKGTQATKLANDSLVPIALFKGNKYGGSPAIFLATSWTGMLVSKL